MKRKTTRPLLGREAEFRRKLALTASFPRSKNCASWKKMRSFSGATTEGADD
jgi:hypothetical protein